MQVAVYYQYMFFSLKNAIRVENICVLGQKVEYFFTILKAWVTLIGLPFVMEAIINLTKRLDNYS
jgi:hypothetical protein